MHQSRERKPFPAQQSKAIKACANLVFADPFYVILNTIALALSVSTEGVQPWR